MSDGKVFFGTKDNFMVALDQKTGQEVWKVSVDDPKQCGCNIISAPLFVKDKVIVGATAAIRRIAAISPPSTPRPAASRGAGTSCPRRAKRATKLERRQLALRRRLALAHRLLRSRSQPGLLGHRQRRGRFLRCRSRCRRRHKSRDVNLYTASVVALDADTGKLRWHFQEVPDDVWDFDSAYEVLLMDRQSVARCETAGPHEQERSDLRS